MLCDLPGVLSFLGEDEAQEALQEGGAEQGYHSGERASSRTPTSPMQHWTRIGTNNAIEQLNREIRRQTRVVGTFPDGRSELMLVTARLKYIVENEWGRRRYLDVSLLEEKEGGV